MLHILKLSGSRGQDDDDIDNISKWLATGLIKFRQNVVQSQ